MDVEALAAVEDFGEFLDVLGIKRPIRNMDAKDFPLDSVAKMKRRELMDSFAIDSATANKIVQAFAKLNKRNGKKTAAPKTPVKVSKLMNLFKLGETKNTSFEDFFDNLDDTPYHPSDQWDMDPCSAAMSCSSSIFEEHWAKITGDCPESYANMPNAHGWTPLMYAASLGRYQIASALLEDGANMIAVNGRGQTALMLAASYGHHPIIQLLAEFAEKNYGKSAIADAIGLHMQDYDNKFTALHYAAYYAQFDALNALLDINANPNIPDKNGDTPTLLCCGEPAQERCLKMLCHAGGKIDAKNNDSQNGLDVAENRKSVRVIHEQAAPPKALRNIPNPRYGHF